MRKVLLRLLGNNLTKIMTITLTIILTKTLTITMTMAAIIQLDLTIRLYQPYYYHHY